MADYAPKPIDMSDVASLLGANPARDYFYAGIARRRPELLSGYAGAQDMRLQDMVNRAYAQTDDVNTMLDELAQQDLANNARKEDLTFLGKALGAQSSDGYRAGVAPILAAGGFPDVGSIVGDYNMLGDSANLDLTDATAYNKRRTGDAAVLNAKAAQSRADNATKLRHEYALDPLTNKVSRKVVSPDPLGDDMLSELFGQADAPITDPAGIGGDPFSTEGTGVGPTVENAVAQTKEMIKADMAGRGKTFVSERPNVMAQDGSKYTGMQFSDGTWVFINEASGEVVLPDGE